MTETVSEMIACAAPGLRRLTDDEIRALLVAGLRELSERRGRTETACWTQLQADRLAALDGLTA